MIKEPTFHWDAEAGIATCTVEYGGQHFTGTAHCHPDDADMKSRLTGYDIATRRARINYLNHVANNELKPKIQVLRHVLGTMAHSKHYNQKSYENFRILTELQNLENDLTAIKEELAEEKVSLKLLLVRKDEYYKLMRKRRAKIDKNSI